MVYSSFIIQCSKSWIYAAGWLLIGCFKMHLIVLCIFDVYVFLICCEPPWVSFREKGWIKTEQINILQGRGGSILSLFCWVWGGETHWLTFVTWPRGGESCSRSLEMIHQSSIERDVTRENPELLAHTSDAWNKLFPARDCFPQENSLSPCKDFIPQSLPSETSSSEISYTYNLLGIRNANQTEEGGEKRDTDV